MKSFNSYSQIKIGFWREFCISLAIALAARASMIFPLNYSEDTYRFLNYPQSINFAYFAAEMRGCVYPVIVFLESIGAFYPYAGALWPIFLTGALVFAGLISMRIWMPNAGSLPVLMGASLFVLFPYQSDYLRFHNAAPLFGLALLLGWSALYFCTRSPLVFLLCIPAMVYAVSGQVLFGFLFLVVFFEAMVWSFGRCLDTCLFSKGIWISAKPWATRMLLLFFSVIVYLIIGQLTLLIAGISPGNRMELSGLDDYPGKMVLYIKQSYFFLLKGEVSLPVFAKFLQLLLIFAIGIAGIQVRILKLKSDFTRMIIWILLICFIVLAVGACMGVMLPLKDARSAMSPRTLSALSVYWAGVFALAWCVSSTAWLRGTMVVLGTILILAYASNTNRQAVDFARINERERLVASRMVERLSLLPEFAKIRTVVMVGATDKLLLDGITTDTNGLNVSSLCQPWSSTAVLREVSGIPFEYPTDAERELAERAAIGKPEWPASGAVFIEGDMGVVVLPKGEK